MHEDTYEFRLWEQGKKWEEVEVFETWHVRDADFETCNHVARSHAESLAAEHQTEVRFNRAGSPMGYYTGTDYKFAHIYGNG